MGKFGPDMSSPEYYSDLVWDKLSQEYLVTPDQAQIQDVYLRWLSDNNETFGGELGEFFLNAEPSTSTWGDAEWTFWKNYVPTPGASARVVAGGSTDYRVTVNGDVRIVV